MFSVQCIEDVDAAYDADSLYWSDPADGKEAVRVLISGTVVMAILLYVSTSFPSLFLQSLFPLVVVDSGWSVPE